MSHAVLVHRVLLIGAALTLLGAAALVLMLQQDSARRHQEQTTEVVEQLCRQTAMLVAERLREHFGAAVFETLEGIGHPELRDYDLPRIAQYFDDGRKHRYVDRFFIWSRQMSPPHEDEVLFYRGARQGAGDVVIAGPDGKSRGALFADSAVGRTIWSHALRFDELKRSFALVAEPLDGRPHQIIIHYIWEDERRHAFIALVGYVVDLTRVREQLFEAMFPGGRPAVPDADRFDLNVSVRDEAGRLVFGSEPPPSAPSATEPIDLVFYPARSLRPWLSSDSFPAPWSISISGQSPVVSDAGAGYWLFAAVVLLILMGLVCAVSLDRQSRRLSEMQSEFVANVSHQLKTPLALLSGAAETLGRGRISSPEKLQEYAGIVHAQAARLSSLVEQAIVYSVADRNGSGLHVEVVDVAGLVREVVDGFRNGVPRELHVQFTADEGVPFVKANAAALEQVVWNLLENAVKYGQPGNSISVSVLAVNGEAVVAVRDRGDGIMADDLPHIFDRFYRSRRHATRRGGFGLGLAFVQKVITAHGGRVSVSSEPGQGAEFRVHLPTA